METLPQVVELRQYTLHPGRRDDLIDLFEREFIEPQEAAGITLIGLFRDLDKPDRFVWLRGFPDMDSRAESLRAFYGGPVWKAHRNAANETMIDSDNVLLLRPADKAAPMPALGDAPGFIAASIYYIGANDEAAMLDVYRRTIEPALVETGAEVVASLLTEPAQNTFPALPVREGENVFVVLNRFSDEAAYERHVGERAASEHCHEAAAELAKLLSQPVETLRLVPTRRSRLR